MKKKVLWKRPLANQAVINHQAIAPLSLLPLLFRFNTVN